MTVEVSPEDYGAAMLYEQLADKVAALPDERSVPSMAARLYCKRIGLAAFLDQLIKLGVPEVAARCRGEMMIRHEFFVRMIHDHADSDEEIEGAAAELAHDLAVFDSPDATMWLLKYLDRIQRCEFRLVAAAKQ